MLAAALHGCATAKPAQPVAQAAIGTTAPAVAQPPSEQPGLRFDVSPREAEVLINGTSVGTVDALSSRGGVVPLDRGSYRVTVKAPGYETWRAEVEIGAKTEVIQLELARRL